MYLTNILNKYLTRFKSSVWLKSIFKHSKWYLVASLSTKALGFILLPLYTQYLTPADYGILTTLEIINYLLPIFFSFTLVSAFDRFYHQPTEDADYLAVLFSSIFWFIIVLGIIAVSGVIASSYFWMPHFLEVPAYPYAFLGFIPALLTEVSLLGFAFFRQSLQAKMVSLVLIGSALVNTAIGLYLVIALEMGVLGRLWGNLAAAIFSCLAVVWYLYRKQFLRWTWNKQLLKNCLKYSIPLIPLMASNWVNIFSDRLIIGEYVDVSAVGLYAIAFHISMVLYFIGESIVQVLAPISMSGLERDKANTKKKISEYTLYLWLFMLYICVFLLLFSEMIIQYFLESSFWETHRIVSVLSVAIVFQIIHRLYGQLIKFHKRTRIYTFAAIGSSVLNLVLNLIFIPRYGYIAAAYTTLITSALYALFIIWQSKKIEHISIAYSKYLLSIVSFLGVVMLTRIGEGSWWWNSLIFIGIGWIFFKIAEISISQKKQ